MAYDKFLNEGRARPYRAQPCEIEQLLQVAARDLAAAERIVPDDLDLRITGQPRLQPGDKKS